MKRLYISDLDGTLLNEDKIVPDKTSEILNRCIDKGISFTFATARSAASAIRITEKIKLNVPCILMNGVCIYDIERKKYVNTEYIAAEASWAVAELLDGMGQSGFMYAISGGRLLCSYNRLDNPGMEEFYIQRRERYDKPFQKIESFSSALSKDVMYFTLLDRFERLDAVRCEIEKIKGLKFEFYRDIYDPDHWYLEIFSDTASKYNGVRFLREKYGFDEVICFGDNLNDLPMFSASDRRIAVENANPQVKAEADEIALPNTESGVALWIEKHID